MVCLFPPHGLRTVMVGDSMMHGVVRALLSLFSRHVFEQQKMSLTTSFFAQSLLQGQPKVPQTTAAKVLGDAPPTDPLTGHEDRDRIAILSPAFWRSTQHEYFLLLGRFIIVVQKLEQSTKGLTAAQLEMLSCNWPRAAAIPASICPLNRTQQYFDEPF